MEPYVLGLIDKVADYWVERAVKALEYYDLPKGDRKYLKEQFLGRVTGVLQAPDLASKEAGIEALEAEGYSVEDMAAALAAVGRGKRA